MRFLNTVLLASFVLGSAFVYAEQNQNLEPSPNLPRKISTRNPASISFVGEGEVILKPMGPPRGQGEEMLEDLTSNDAPYLRRKSQHAYVAGICRTANAAYYQTGQKGYDDCLENGGYPTNSESSLGAARQRTAAALLIPVSR